VVEANGRKHLTKAEAAERRELEIHVKPPDRVTPPAWLGKKYHAEYVRIGDILLATGLYSELDQDVLAQYFVNRDRWEKADKKAGTAIRKNDEKLAKEWTSIQATYFKQARQCASAMGLDVTSRCRLVVPGGSGQQSGEEDNPFLTLIRGGKAANG
jgi:P27 family predicted phage terminase small subunit